MTTIPFDDLKLVELVRQNKHLYDKQCSEYRDLLKKDITWKAIAAALGTSADICRKRFRCLRDRFNKEKKSRKKEMLEATSLPLVFKKMMFLWDHLSHRNSYGPMRFSLPENYSSEDQIKIQDIFEVEPRDVSDGEVQNSSETEEMSPSKVAASSSTEFVSHISEEANHVWDDAGNKHHGEDTECVVKPRKKLKTSAESPVTQPNDVKSPRLTSDVSCNSAFCTVVKDYLDKIANPVKLSTKPGDKVLGYTEKSEKSKSSKKNKIDKLEKQLR